jgi:hypothetical protein
MSHIEEKESKNVWQLGLFSALLHSQKNLQDHGKSMSGYRKKANQWK